MFFSFDEFIKLSSLGMAWENHIGPHIARGGSMEELEGLMTQHQIPEGLKNRFRQKGREAVQRVAGEAAHTAPQAASVLGGIAGKIKGAPLGARVAAGVVGGAAGLYGAKAVSKAFTPKKNKPGLEDTRASLKTASKDLIPGGLADSGPPKNVDPEQVRKGIKSELEHTNRRDIAKEIALDHLTEDPVYYTKLEKMEKKSSLFEELFKLGAISEEQARQSLDRLDSLERSKPTTGQVMRYGAIGGAAAPGIKVLTNAIQGKALHDFGQAGSGLKSIARGATGTAVGGALMAGAVPLIRSHFDRKAEAGTLKKYVDQYERQHQVAEQTPNPVAPTKVASIHKMFPRASSVMRRSSWDLDKQALNVAVGSKDDAAEKLKKVGFQQSAYGSTGGYVDFHQISSQAPFRKPSLQTPVDQKVDALYGVKTSEILDSLVREMAQEDIKEAGAMTPGGLSPASMLASSQRIAKPKITAPSGPSIGDIAKPMGFGRKISGATKTM